MKMKTQKQTILSKAYNNTDLDDISRESQISREFYDILISFIIEHPEFKYVCGLNAFKNVSGTYVIALNSLNKFKVGFTSDLYASIMSEWQKISNEDIFTYAKVFINPNTNSIHEIEHLFPKRRIANDCEDIKMKVEIKDKIKNVDKVHIAIAAGGLLAVIGAISLAKYMVSKHE